MKKWTIAIIGLMMAGCMGGTSEGSGTLTGTIGVMAGVLVRSDQVSCGSDATGVSGRFVRGDLLVEFRADRRPYGSLGGATVSARWLTGDGVVGFTGNPRCQVTADIAGNVMTGSVTCETRVLPLVITYELSGCTADPASAPPVQAAP